MRASAARDLPAIGWDPCPGDVPGARSLVDDLRSLAGRLDDAAYAAREDATTWRGAAAALHRDRVEALPGSLQCVAASVGRLADVVEGWAEELVGWQARADDLERRTREAQVAEQRTWDGVMTLRQATRADDAIHGRPPGWTAFTAAQDPLADAREARQARLAEAEVLHERYSEAGAVVKRSMEAAVADGLRAPWSGAVPGGLRGLDGLLLRPAQPLGRTLWRDYWQDGYGELVRHDAEELDRYADGSAVASGVGLVPLGVTQVLGAGAAVSSAATTAQLEYFVDDDPLGAVTGVGQGAVGLVGLGRAGRAARGGLPPTGTSPDGRPGRRGERLDDTSGTVSELAAVGEEVPAWELEGHFGTARRREAEVRSRAEEEARSEQEHRSAADVRRCLP